MNYIAEDQVSITEDNYDILAAYSESSSPSPEHLGAGEQNREHDVIRNCFISGLGRFGEDAKVMAVHKNLFSGLSGQTKLRRFRLFSEAVLKKNGGGDPNIKFAWYGGSRKQISDIISHGFAHSRAPGELYGHGLYLSPAKFSLNSVLPADVDDNGLGHILLCRVILGKAEQICVGSEQCHPSSEEFDSGVDNLEEPTKYIVWTCYMNSHILPCFVITYKAPLLTGLPRSQGSALRPRLPYMSFPKLMSDLETYLAPSEMILISKYHDAFQAKKITKKQLITKVRQIAGDNTLKSVIELSRNKTSVISNTRGFGDQGTNKSNMRRMGG